MQRTNQVGSQSQTTEISNTGLGRFRLEFSINGRYETDVEESKVVVTNTELELSHRFDEWS